MPTRAGALRAEALDRRAAHGRRSPGRHLRHARARAGERERRTPHRDAGRRSARTGGRPYDILKRERHPRCEDVPVRLAVVGHVEWVEFARVERVPRPGEIVHALETWQEAGGGGAVAAVQLAKLAGTAALFTSLGADELGNRALEQLRSHGVEVHASRPDEPTRRAFTYIDGGGERTITVLGAKLRPRRRQDLPWHELAR